MILNFRLGRIEVIGALGCEERSALQRAASRALPSHGIAPETTNGWRIERRTARGDRQILDFPLERLTVICCDFDMDEGEWRRLLRATCQRLMMTAGHLCLHAVVARLHGKTFAIAGGHGTGKSSLGALLHEQGGELLSGDFTVIGWPSPSQACALAGTHPLLLRSGDYPPPNLRDPRLKAGTAVTIEAPAQLTTILYLENNQRGSESARMESPPISRRTLNDLYLNASTGFDQTLERFRYPLGVLNSDSDQRTRFTLIEQLMHQVRTIRARGSSQYLANLLTGATQHD